MSDKLKVGSYEFHSRLIVGTGKYSSFDVMVRAHQASGADLVTVAIARVKIPSPLPSPLGRGEGGGEETMLDYIDRNRFTILPNTAGAYTAEDAIRISRLARAAGIGNLVKLEVLGD